MKRGWALKAVLWLLALALAAAAAYVGYVWLSYSRLEDNRALAVDNNQQALLPAGKALTAMTMNIGFGAYTPQFTFFMDGGRYARAFSDQSVREATQGVAGVIAQEDPALVLLQEVDVDSDRSHHVDQSALLSRALPDWAGVFALNYDSAYLFYPLTQPTGRSPAGLMSLSRYHVEDALRRSLPVEGGFQKFFDLDRCFAQMRLPVDNGRYLTLINLHASAYTKDASVRAAQLELLAEAMAAAREQGDYVICGGDFNRDLLGGDSPTLFGFEWRDESWLQPLEEEMLGEDMRLCAPTNAPTARDSGVPYVAGETFVAIVDGFVVSPDVGVVEVSAVETGFAYSDHNPVLLRFILT